MPIRYPAEFVGLQNFELAWERVLRGSNAQYKRFFSHLFPSYTFASRTILADLVSDIRTGTYQPSPATTVYLPKPSRILRPITLLSLNDQIVYQAIANVIANRFYASLRARYGVSTFGALYAGRNSKFFYRSWKKSYRTFNAAIKKAYLDGNDVLADFDLVSFFDLIDHTVLKKVLARRVRSGELLALLFECLSHWTQGNPNVYKRGHGIPQGPEPSAFLAEVFLHDFDTAKYGRVKYLRYVDDIKVLGKTFGAVRRALLRLDIRSKNLGLVPQAQKIDVRGIADINAELKGVPSNIAGPSSVQSIRPLTKSSKKRLERLLRGSVERRKKGGELIVKDDTRLKFALYRLPSRLRTLRLMEPLFSSRPDLSGALGHYASGFSNSRKCAEVLHAALKADPVFDAAAGDYVLALDRCAPQPEPRKYRVFVAKLWNRSEEKSLLLEIPAKLYGYKRTSRLAAVKSLARESCPINAGLLIHYLGFDPRHASLSAGDLESTIKHFAKFSNEPDLVRYCTYLMLTELKLIPTKTHRSGALLLRHLGLRVQARRQSLLPGFFRDHFGLVRNLNWERLLGKRAHSEAQRRTNVIRGHWGASPSILITALDSFNDLLVQRFSSKHRRLRGSFRRAAGRYRIPDFGNWLQNPLLQRVLVNGCSIFAECHRMRLVADLAHAKLKTTGKFTRPITYRESARIVTQLAAAYRELLTEWSTI